MNVYEQLQKMIESDNNQDIQQQILVELKEIKQLLSKKEVSSNRERYNKKSQAYYDFVNKLRKELRADIENNIYPEILYYNRKLGINFKGYIYDKETTRNLPTQEAYKVYEYLFSNRDNLVNLIKK